MSGEKERQPLHQKRINYTLANQSPPLYLFDRVKQNPFNTDNVLNRHLKAVENSQRSRQTPASSSNHPESPHEPKGLAGRPSDHGGTTETRKYPLWWGSQDAGFIHAQLSNMGWREPHFNILPNKGYRSNDYQKNSI